MKNKSFYHELKFQFYDLSTRTDDILFAREISSEEAKKLTLGRFGLLVDFDGHPVKLLQTPVMLLLTFSDQLERFRPQSQEIKNSGAIYERSRTILENLPHSI